MILAIVAELNYLEIHCYFGEMTTQSFLKFSNCLYELQWYNLPIQLGKYLLIILPNMQRSLFYDGFGMFPLTLQTFAPVNLKLRREDLIIIMMKFLMCKIFIY